MLDPHPERRPGAGEALAESGRPWMEWVGGRQIEAGMARLTGEGGFGVDAAIAATHLGPEGR